MVQDSSALAPFFRAQIEKNNQYNSVWGKHYRQLVEQIQAEKPNFSEATIRQVWYERDNGVSSLMQGGMSLVEFENAQKDLLTLTRQIAEECTQENYNRVIERLIKLKADGVLNKVYRALCNRAFAAIYPSKISSVVNVNNFFSCYNYCNNHFQLGLSGEREWLARNVDLKETLNRALGDDIDPIELNMSLWHLYAYEIQDKNAIGLVGSESALQENEQEDDVISSPLPKNTILYGPPGTGKTYRTIEIAVQICDPIAYSLQEGKDESEKRRELKKIYDQLIKDNRVRFITFHQSFGYEEFIEGLRAETTDDGNVKYEIKAGIFKQICEDAAFGHAGAQEMLDSALTRLQERLSEGENITLETQQGKAFQLTYKSQTNFGIFPSQSKKEDLGQGYNAYLKDIRQVYQDPRAKVHNPSYVRSILNYLINQRYLPLNTQSVASEKKENYVLIIDEINRGNISKIFGELITLIEPSKRAGEPESLSVLLPYSSTPFSVPNNLYLIGTMNTADHSLTALDTALRRRFDFEAMLPDITVLKDTVIKGIDLPRLLQTLNDRIQVLYDREHMLGHAFFIPVVQAKEDEALAFERFKRIMRNKILPLLEEYFYNNWQKIRMVLADNQKEEAPDLQFVREVKYQKKYADLFGDNGTDDLGTSFHLAAEDDNVWDNPIAWQQIYAPQKEKRRSAE
ncbi:McrB family protein [Escherichia coli]|nr:McrB family protein [Escherichia coli]EGI3945992.1 McrB family protein [Escherichia coli]EGI3988575.1 McrB family protein [Escherichia coli]EGI4037239.1 McrB family protein [Escherichia coli]ELU7127357.1 McrB family protein [Escherichia coli]